MKETKFRALIDDMNCKWVYGNLIYNKGGIYGERTPRIQIDESDCLFVTCIAGTEGQFTGLKDKNGVDIYEGDRYKHGSSILTIVWYEYGFYGYDEISKEYNILNKHHQKHFEVIGNIHDIHNNTKEETL